MTITERIHTFGADAGLMGIVTLPAGASVDRPFVILLNAGLVHRVGPFGMAVELARSLASRGFPVLRFDQTGLGDSPPGTGGTSIEAQVVADGRAAMDSLSARYGATRFVIGGLCSGALNAHRICVADPRVVAMWMLDGYAYPTRRYYQHVLLRRLAMLDRPKAWVTLGRRIWFHARVRLDRRRGVAPVGADHRHVDARQAIFSQDWPAIGDARRDIEQMLARGVRMLCVYTGGWSSFVDPRQFDEMFPRLNGRDQVSVTYYPWADHSYLALEDRAAMVRDVGAFVGALPAA